jgi:hypothetical protein
VEEDLDLHLDLARDQEQEQEEEELEQGVREREGRNLMGIRCGIGRSYLVSD